MNVIQRPRRRGTDTPLRCLRHNPGTRFLKAQMRNCMNLITLTPCGNVGDFIGVSTHMP